LEEFPMNINLTELRKKEGELTRINEEVEIEAITFHQEKLPVTEPLRVSGGAILTEDGTVHLSLDFSTTVVQHCRRCLEPLEAQIDHHEELEFRLGIETEIASDGDISIYRYQKTDNKIDILPYLRRFIKLDLDPYPLCKPDCKGLCPHCGANLNKEKDHKCPKEQEETEAKDPRMKKLAELL